MKRYKTLSDIVFTLTVLSKMHVGH